MDTLTFTGQLLPLNPELRFSGHSNSWLVVHQAQGVYSRATIDLTLCDYRIEGNQLLVTMKEIL